MLGFPVLQANPFSETLERQAAALERHYRHGYLALLAGMNDLHDAVDAALAGDDTLAESLHTAGVAALERCFASVAGIADVLVRTRADLGRHAEEEPLDPLVARERFFASIDYEQVYRELAAHGAALPQRAFWDDMAGRVRDGGAVAGLRLLDRHARELQSDLRVFLADLAAAHRLEGRDYAVAVHDVARPVAALVVGFTRFLMGTTYLSMLCERASAMLEAAEGGATAAVA
jgi:hypothetical protein